MAVRESNEILLCAQLRSPVVLPVRRPVELVFKQTPSLMEEFPP
jgi:hypothetical protein